MIGALPGASEDPGTGPVVEPLVDELLADLLPLGLAPADVPAALRAHREHKAAWYGDLVGPLRVPAASTADLQAALLPRDHALPVRLVVDPAAEDPAGQLALAYTLLLDDDRAHVDGVELPLPAAESPAQAARVGLAGLGLSVPAWFVIPPLVGWEPALDVLAEDGAENVALHLHRPAADPVGAATALAGAAAVLRAAIDRDLPLTLVGGELPLVTGPTGIGLLNALGAVRTALNGAEVDELVAVLAAEREDPLAAAARRMSEADAAVVRSFLTGLACPSVRETVKALEVAGLIAPDAA